MTHAPIIKKKIYSRDSSPWFNNNTNVKKGEQKNDTNNQVQRKISKHLNTNFQNTSQTVIFDKHPTVPKNLLRVMAT